MKYMPFIYFMQFPNETHRHMYTCTGDFISKAIALMQWIWIAAFQI